MAASRRRRDRDGDRDRRGGARGAGGSVAASGADVAPVELTVERVVAGGDGLARQADGRVVFVPTSLPGERVAVSIRAAKKDFARGEVRDVLEPHDSRVVPPCPVWHRGCGGCDWQHADRDLQVEMKAGIVREALRRTGGIDDPQVEVAGAVPPWGYRTTMRFALDVDGRPSLRRTRSNDLVGVETCLIAAPLIADLLPALRLPGADEVTIRVSVATGERTAWWTPDTNRAPGLPADVRVGADACLTERVGGVDLRVSASSFFQSGPAAAQLLIDSVRVACGDELVGAARVVDAYGGVGLFGATVLSGAEHVTLVEGSASACEDARHNLAGRDVEIACCAVESWRPTAADLVVADPSRQGLGADAVDRLAATGAPTLVLVSCDPVALARDAALLRGAGFTAGTTRVLDLFPQTHHVEAVTRFDR